MEKKDLVKFLDELFIPLGFKRKGNNWIINGEEINKIINLQKSQYSNSFYINYGYIMKSLPLEGFVHHVDNRLSSTDKSEQEYITKLLDLESEMEDLVRFEALEKLINNKIIIQMQCTNNENDLLTVLKQKQFLYTVPPNVLKHFNLTINN